RVLENQLDIVNPTLRTANQSRNRSATREQYKTAPRSRNLSSATVSTYADLAEIAKNDTPLSIQSSSSIRKLSSRCDVLSSRLGTATQRDFKGASKTWNPNYDFETFGNSN
ncbi:hypothetical protein HK100_001502, partial [Physocladia obscura]